MNTSLLDLGAVLSSLQLDCESPTDLQLLHLANVVERARPYSGTWEFPWLLSSWNATTWETRIGARTRQDQEGNWIDTGKTHWDILLPDGCRLTDPAYAGLLETCRKLSALVRVGYATAKPPVVTTWSKFNRDILNICHWMVLHENRYSPAEMGFQLLDQFGLKHLLSKVAQGGWCEALCLVDRCLSQLYLRAFDQPIPQDLLDSPARLPTEVCDRIVGWLERNEGFALLKTRNSGRVSRVLIGKLISMNNTALTCHAQLNAVLRQFEIGHQDKQVLVSGAMTTEFPGHTAPLLIDVLDQPAAFGTVRCSAKSLRMLFALYRHLPDQIPSPAGINLTEAFSVARTRSAEQSHTPFIPIDVGLTYLNVALEWVVLYGDPLIDYVLSIMKKFTDRRADSKTPESFKLSNNGLSEKIFASTPLPKALRDAGFSFSSYTVPHSKTNTFDRLREKPSLSEALGILVGAVTILIGLMKPSRDLEIVNLPKECLYRSPQGLYWLDSLLANRNSGDQRAMTGGKPIPFITARGIGQIYKLNQGLTRLFEEKDVYKKNMLFYLPNVKKFGTALKHDSGMLNGYLDLFCDFVGMPPDQYGRRWYVRQHEMRKWFILLLFWSGRFDVLDAARWIAGHTDVEHLYDYIQREYPGAQLGKLEAECAIDHLALYDETQVVMEGECVGLVELYERVLNHFRVRSLSLLKERDWHLLIEELFEDDYHLEPYAISTEDGSQRLCIAVRMGPREGAI